MGISPQEGAGPGEHGRRTTLSTQTSYSYPVFCPTLPDPVELLGEMRGVFSSGCVTAGRQVSLLEKEVAELTGVLNVVATSSGTSGLMLLLKALELPRGSEVICPSFTFAATAHALLWNGLKPVFCDSEPESFTMDAGAAEQLITERTSAICPVCIFGVPGDLNAYERVATRHGLALLYDSAQGLGSAYMGRRLGNFGTGEMFSLSPTKVVTAMEGGLVTTNDDELAGILRRMRDYGKSLDGEDMHWLGLSARMTEMNALVARWSLARLDTWIANRTAIMARYRERLAGLPGMSWQEMPSQCTSSRNYIVVVLDPEQSPVSRDELHSGLKLQGVQTKRYFYPALHNQTLYRGLDPDNRRRLPVAERLSERCLALPMYSHMSLDTVDEICDRATECLCKSNPENPESVFANPAVAGNHPGR